MTVIMRIYIINYFFCIIRYHVKSILNRKSIYFHNFYHFPYMKNSTIFKICLISYYSSYFSKRELMLIVNKFLIIFW